MIHSSNKIFLFFFLAISIHAIKLKSQTLPDSADCINAVPICTNFYSCPTQANGMGLFPNEINSSNSCLGSGEKNGCWYTFTVQTSGNLNFTITPINNDDYDWALYNMTNAICSQIYNNAALEVSCNYDGAPGPTGPNGLPGPQNEPPVPVLAGQTYVLYISHFTTGNALGYTFDLGLTTATIYDASPPYPKEIVSTPPLSPLTCGLNKISLKFSENIRCGSIDTNDLAIYCPNNIHHHLTNLLCKSTGLYSNTFDITLLPALTDSGLHKIYLTRSDPSAISDLCGNTAAAVANFSHDTVPFRVKGIKRIQQIKNVNCYGDSTGTAKITPSNGTAPYQYSWLTSPAKTSPNLSNARAGNYICIIKDAKGCSIRDSLQITEHPQLIPTITNTWDTCGKGTGVAFVSVTGGEPGYTYKWDDILQQTNDTATHLFQGAYTVTIIDTLGCDTVVPFNVYTAPIVHPSFDYNPKALSLFFPDCNFTDLSSNAVKWFWNFGDGDTSYHQNPFHKFIGDGTFPVKLVIENAYGCEDSVIVEVYVDGFYTLYLPSTFSPNGDGKNDVFQIRGTGLISDKYELTIYARNGQVVFKTNDLEKGWDGTFGGTLAKADSYVYDIYFMDYKFKSHQKRGVFTIVR
ncbi:MAG: gliding motility-associated C-terminal domain-containing protein [Bacteroidetes bacterium]|nr:gliding motility-associated C-terminal domain-containing protein [Bacteroidota bacterium]